MANDALSQILDACRMRGAVYFHTHFSPPWGVDVPAYRNVSRFHMAIRGQCWVRIEGASDPVHLSTGDLIVIPRGTTHILSDNPNRKPEHLDKVLSRSGYKGEGALVYGGVDKGEACKLFCGHFEFDSAAIHPLLTALPKFIYLPNTETMNAQWLESVIRFVSMEVTGEKAGADAIVRRLTEIIFIQVVRAFVDRAGDAAGCLAGVLDPQLSKSLSALHLEPEAQWTVKLMAEEAGMSRTLFAERFASLIGMTPLTYATLWRMQLARRELVETRRSITEISEAVGYGSEAAFTRAFKRHFDATPASVRRGAS